MGLEMMNNILVVDDDRLIRNLLFALLSESGYSVDLAENGRDGFDKVKNSSYDLIISDVNMPEMNGLDFYSAVRENLPGLEKRFLFLTSSQAKEINSFFSTNECRYVFKPFKPVDLLGEVASILTPSSKRREERHDWSAYCQISAGESAQPASVVLVAKTMDISHHGAKIRYFGTPLSPGRQANIYLKDLDVKRVVTVVWSKSVNESAMSGLLSPEDIPTIYAEHPPTVQPHTSF